MMPNGAGSSFLCLSIGRAAWPHIVADHGLFYNYQVTLKKCCAAVKRTQ